MQGTLKDVSVFKHLRNDIFPFKIKQVRSSRYLLASVFQTQMSPLMFGNQGFRLDDFLKSCLLVKHISILLHIQK